MQTKNLEDNFAQITTYSQQVKSQLDPIMLLQALSSEDKAANRMLLESCQIDNKQKVKSILMNKAALRIECQQQVVTITSLTDNGYYALEFLATQFNQEIKKLSGNLTQLSIQYQSPLSIFSSQQLDEEQRLKQITPIDCLRTIQTSFKSKNNHPFALFLCGLFSFDFIASFEDLPEVPFADNDCPDFVFYLAEEIIVFDHQKSKTHVYLNQFSTNESQNINQTYNDRIEQISSVMQNKDLTSSSKTINTDFSTINNNLTDIEKVSCDLTDQEYEDVVIDLKKQIVAGNIFQVVPSRTFSLKCLNTLQSYQQLKITNPSPYMFYMQDENFILFGASPESALKYQTSNNKVDLYPIAGTRPRGKKENGEIDHDLDKRLEVELKLDFKEVAEHMMLVDLARNDIARISDTGSIKIPRLIEVDRYSQVMHLVSCVEGNLKQDLDCFHAYQACMNMGTLTGAPKIKATELIRQTEKKRRGSYGGAVGYINTQGDMDTCIVIRSAFCKNGVAHIQAGAGIVFDSQPKAEADETKAKAAAVINAIQQANLSIIESSTSNSQSSSQSSNNQSAS